MPDTPQRSNAELASLAVNAANALRDEKRHYEIAAKEAGGLRKRVEDAERERDQYASAIRHLIRRIKHTGYVWSQTLPETIRTDEVVKALGSFAPLPLPEGLRDDLWQRIVGAYYVRFENDGHPEDAEAAADEAMSVVQPELERLRKAERAANLLAGSHRRAEQLEAELEQLRAELEAARERWTAGLQRADEVVREMSLEVQRYAAGDEMPVLWSVYNRMHLRAANAEADIHSARLLHKHNAEDDYCDLCSNHGDVDWPCATIRALDGEQRLMDERLDAVIDVEAGLREVLDHGKEQQ